MRPSVAKITKAPCELGARSPNSVRLGDGGQDGPTADPILVPECQRAPPWPLFEVVLGPSNRNEGPVMQLDPGPCRSKGASWLQMPSHSIALMFCGA